MKLFNFAALFLTLFTVFLASPKVAAANETSFTSCLTPTGTVIANYESGVHGIPGQDSKTGRDTVYSLENGNAMQCFCGTDGHGIQTNWMKTSQLSEDQIKVYENQGWIYIPSGAAWGLSDEPYLAQNSSYSCNGSSSTSGGDGMTDGRTDGKSDGLGSIVQASTGTNLASTGNIVFILEVFAAGLLMIVAGLILRKSVK